VNGEARAGNCETTAEWFSKVWFDVREDYSDSEISNTDETEIFFRLTIDTTFKFEGENLLARSYLKTE
jgi:hypothetical protein